MLLWKIDTAHSEIKFKVKHLVVSTVTGQFNEFQGSVDANSSDFSDAKITFEADVNSVNTKNAQRDGHLKSADFFDAEHHPKITFQSKSISKKSKNIFDMTGNLTIRGTTKEVTLSVVYNGSSKGFGGVDVAGFEITGNINRFDFGLHWNTLTEAGGVVVSENIKLEIDVELQKIETVHIAA